MSVTLAIPSKGRLKDRSLEILTQAGFQVDLPQSARSYFGKLGNIDGVDDVEIAFLSASEIARELISGNIAMGITGEDLAREANAQADAFLEFSLPLQFGQADVVIALPQAWIDVQSMSDLADVAAEFRTLHGRRLRIATKYWHLTQNFFAQHGISAYRIVESLGATEGAPASGSADIIVDITSTGSTLKANSLKLLPDGIILKSQANLICSKSVEWSNEDLTVKQALCLGIAKVVRN